MLIDRPLRRRFIACVTSICVLCHAASGLGQETGAANPSAESLEENVQALRGEVQALSVQVEELITALKLRQTPQAPESVAESSQTAPAVLKSPDFDEVWELSLQEVIHVCLQNSEILRKLGGVVPWGQRGDSTINLARINLDVSLETFETSVRDLIANVENTYWELWSNYEELETAQQLRDDAQQFWKRVFERREAGTAGARSQQNRDEAAAREQYFFFRAQLEAAQARLFDSEHRLRFHMGLTARDGRLIRPADELLGHAGENLKNARALGQLASSSLNRDSTSSAENERIKQAYRDLNLYFNTVGTHLNRWQAARKEVETLTLLHQNGLRELDLVLDAQRRVGQSRNDYYRALADFVQAGTSYRQVRRTLLKHHRVQLGQAVGDSKAEPKE